MVPEKWLLGQMSPGKLLHGQMSHGQVSPAQVLIVQYLQDLDNFEPQVLSRSNQ